MLEVTRIYLVGFMGSGKTTTGKRLAERLGMDFTDVDEEIEKREGVRIADIFRLKGEDYFRELESRLLRDLSLRENVVIATGGGIVEREENRNFLKSTGIVIWLYISWDELANRGIICDVSRPVSMRPDLKYIYVRRNFFYKEIADIKVVVDKKSEEEIVGEICGYLEKN
ncbi:MAG: shikimate kinase [candidate division WOR-3 bacterium]